ncbi:MAG: hypothetical protein ACI8UZ_001972 [Akkermansiaceae bacterium]|jgi:hypothetical protein
MTGFAPNFIPYAKPSNRPSMMPVATDPFEENELSKESPNLLREMSRAFAKIDHSCQLSRDGKAYRF